MKRSVTRARAAIAVGALVSAVCIAPLSGDDKAGDLYEQAVAIVLRDKKASTSYLQRRLSIGYNRAADLIDRMEGEGVISPANHAGRREILLAG